MAGSTLTVKKTGSFLDMSLSTHYNAYCKAKKISKYDKVDRLVMLKVVGNIFKEIGIQMVEAKGGVLIRNFGYFFVWKTQAKTTFGEWYRHTDRQPQFNYATKNYMYKPVFVPAGGAFNLRFWSMDNKFERPLRVKIKHKLIAGFKYRTYVYSLRKLLNLR
jgi:hypothetical protein